MTLPGFNELGFGEVFFKQADPLITRNLEERGLLFRAGRVRHSYPFCWRCDAPLLYYAKQSWYICTTAYKDRLLANNELINWVPEHIRHGRFGNWLENNVDWALSRERYWGTPLPIWTCDSCSAVEVIGSIKELSERANSDRQDLDLHRCYIAQVSWHCSQWEDGTLQRVRYVADCWFDSGSMPVAQWHYPFENQEMFALAGQADYISEAIDQTRGWFYTLHAVSTLLFDRPAYKNVICLGHILDAKGEKMSKSRNNVVDPWQVMDTYGADATRWYMCASAPPYNPRSFSTELVGDMLRQFLLTLWNTYSFFVLYGNLVAKQDPSAPESVHLASWPEANPALIDRQLLADADLLLECVSLARSARRNANLRVRQPLSELLIRVPRGNTGLHRFVDELQEELNVKEVRFLEVGDELVTYRFKPNLPVAGKKYGRLVPKIKHALESLSGQAAAEAAYALEAEQPIEIQFDGQTIQLEPGEVLVEATSPSGYAVAEGNGLLVALNTALTPELKLEGQARDLVRFIQDARKTAGLAITDRIHLTLQPAEGLDVTPMLAAHSDFIRSETLADSLAVGPIGEGNYTTEVEFDGGAVMIGIISSNLRQ